MREIERDRHWLRQAQLLVPSLSLYEPNEKTRRGLCHGFCSAERSISIDAKAVLQCGASYAKWLLKVSPEDSLWCNDPYWSTGGIGSWVGAFCWVFWAPRTVKGLRSGPSENWVHPQCCSRSHRATRSYRHCCLRPRKQKEVRQSKHRIPGNFLTSRMRVIKYVLIGVKKKGKEKKNASMMVSH